MTSPQDVERAPHLTRRELRSDLVREMRIRRDHEVRVECRECVWRDHLDPALGKELPLANGGLAFGSSDSLSQVDSQIARP